jgi:predicted nucleic acid-binding protein
MPPLVFDTSIYITLLRNKGEAALRLTQIAGGEPVWLSSVVLEELYAGANARSLAIIERLEQDFSGLERVFVPNLSDWTRTGQILARLAAKYDYEHVGRGRLTNDTLIATSAGRRGFTVVTANVRDFSKLAEFIPFQWRLGVDFRAG